MIIEACNGLAEAMLAPLQTNVINRCECQMPPFFEGIINRLTEIFDPTALGGLVADIITDGIVGGIVFVFFILLWFVLRWVLPPVLDRTRLDETSKIFLTALVKYAVLILGGVQALSAAGINTASVLASLGIAGLTIGFAARDAFSNLISGFLIYLDRPFVIGDLVEIEDNYGRVDKITLRSTRIITSDGKMLAVPNADIINKTVASYTNFPHLRLDVPITIGVNENIDQARKVLLKIVHDNPEYMQEPPPRVVVTALNDYNVQIELQAWLDNEREHVPERSDLRENVFNALNAAGIEMPYETIQLTPVEIKQLS